jgi:hypothetical protein
MLRGPRRVGGCDPDSPAHQLTRTMLDGGWRAHGTRKLAELLDLLPLLDPRHHADPAETVDRECGGVPAALGQHGGNASRKAGLRIHRQ